MAEMCAASKMGFFRCKDELTDLKLVIEDTIDNVATLQDCSMDQRESLQLLSENSFQLTA